MSILENTPRVFPENSTGYPNQREKLQDCLGYSQLKEYLTSAKDSLWERGNLDLSYNPDNSQIRMHLEASWPYLSTENCSIDGQSSLSVKPFCHSLDLCLTRQENGSFVISVTFPDNMPEIKTFFDKDSTKTVCSKGSESFETNISSELLLPQNIASLKDSDPIKEVINFLKVHFSYYISCDFYPLNQHIKREISNITNAISRGELKETENLKEIIKDMENMLANNNEKPNIPSLTTTPPQSRNVFSVFARIFHPKRT